MCLPFVFDRVGIQRYKVLCSILSLSYQVIRLLLILGELCPVSNCSNHTVRPEAASFHYFQSCGL